MILIEIFSDSSKQMFLNVPPIFHKDLMSLYCRSLKLCVNKPQFVKVSSLELIRMKYIQEEFNAFDVEEILEDFTKFYYDLEKKELEKVKFGFEEDIKEFIWEYLNYN
jgi:hypothetical protein